MKKKTKKKTHTKRPVRRRMKQLDMFPSATSANGIKSTSPLMVRFTPEQYAYVRHAAALRGQNAAAFIRVATLAQLEVIFTNMKPAELTAWKRDADRAATARTEANSHE